MNTNTPTITDTMNTNQYRYRATCSCGYKGRIFIDPNAAVEASENHGYSSRENKKYDLTGCNHKVDVQEITKAGK